MRRGGPLKPNEPVGSLGATGDLPPASDAVRTEWLRRVEAEYRSAALTHHLTHGLIQIGAPPDLIEIGLRIVGDELAHSELSHAVCRAAGSAAAPQLDRTTLVLPERPGETLEARVIRHGIEIFCFGETVAVRLFSRLRAGCTVDVAKLALDRILRDEVVHRDFGWALLEWLLTTPLAHDARTFAERQAARLLERVYRSYCGGPPDTERRDRLCAQQSRFDPNARAWGLMPQALYLEAVDETLERDYRPRYAELGLSFAG